MDKYDREIIDEAYAIIMQINYEPQWYYTTRERIIVWNIKCEGNMMMCIHVCMIYTNVHWKSV